MDTESIELMLADVQDDRRDIRLQAELALLRLQDPVVVPALLAALDIPDRRVQGLVATVLGRLGDRRAVLPLIDLLRSAKPGTRTDVFDTFANVRAQAAEALGLLGDRQAVEPLIEALADEDAVTRGKAAQALGRLRDLRAVEPLIASLRAEHNPSTATILGNLGDRRAAEPLLDELEELRRSPAGMSKIQAKWEELRLSPAVLSEIQAKWQAIYYYYVIRALGKLRDQRAKPLLKWVQIHEQTPVLKGKSLSDMAAKALARIAERNASAETAELEEHGK